MRSAVVTVVALLVFGALFMLNPAALAWLAWQGATGRLGRSTQVIVAFAAVVVIAPTVVSFLRRQAVGKPAGARRGAPAKKRPATAAPARASRRATNPSSPRRPGKRRGRRTMA